MRKTETFQNLLVISLADGIITPAEKELIDAMSYKLGITDEEYTYYINNIGSLDFVIPENKDDAANEIYKMALLCMEDGELQEEELERLYDFGTRAGFTEEECANLIDYVLDSYDSQYEQTREANKKQYDRIASSIRAEGHSDSDIARIIRKVIQSRDFNYAYSKDPQIDHDFYSLLWLIYCRYIKLNPSGVVMSMMALELIESGEYILDDFLVTLKLSEDLATDGVVLEFKKSGKDAMKAEVEHILSIMTSNLEKMNLKE